MNIRQEYLKEKEIDCYVQQWQKEKPSFSDEYVEWLEAKINSNG